MDPFVRVLIFDRPDPRQAGDLHREEEYTIDDETIPAGWWISTGYQYIDFGPFETEEAAREATPEMLEMAEAIING